MPNLPSHASPLFAPSPKNPSNVSNFDLTNHNPTLTHPAPPPTLLSPAFTPPSTPGDSTPSTSKSPSSTLLDASHPPSHDSAPTPALLDTLPTVTCVVRARIPTTSGSEMFLHLYHNNVDDKEHLAIVFGPRIRSRSLDEPRHGETELDRMIRGAYVGRLHPGRVSSRWDEPSHDVRSHNPMEAAGVVNGADKVGGKGKQEKETLPLVRIHSECYTGETAWSARCDCGEQLDEAARLMSLPGCPGGVIVYLRQEGRGIGLGEKLKAYNLQDLGSDTVEANLLLRHPADARSYGLATAILVDLGFGRDAEGGEENEVERGAGIRLLTNNPEKIRAVEGPNREVEVRERVAMVPISWKTGGKKGVRGEEIEGYLRTKIGKMGHMIE